MLDSSPSNGRNLILFGRTLVKAIINYIVKKPIVPLIWTPLKFSRPCGTKLTNPVFTHALEPLRENSDPNSVPQGRLKIGRDAILDNFQPSLRDLIMFHDVPRTSVLG